MSRYFKGGERTAMFVASGGKCAICGNALESGWHGDHIKPHSAGGVTDVVNGQATCRHCNLKKGARYVSGLSAWSGGDREWAMKAFARYIAKDQANFLTVATPGAGKTKLGLRIAHDAITTGRADRIVVVCPTDHLKRQWADKAAECGLHLDPDWENKDGVEAADFHGIVVTYQSVANATYLHRLHCRKPTLVIFDEIHHAGDNLAWGRSVKDAFEPAMRRLCLSGTCFRSDNSSIPFVTYEDGRSKPDYEYTYADALSDSVCRPILFPSFEGEMTWMSLNGMFTATFRDELPEDEVSKRLRTALDVNGLWLKTILAEADAKLREIRKGEHRNAGALVIAMDQSHAKNIAELLEAQTGDRPHLAISEDPQASTKITDFANGNSRWIVAVKMISEGVDIPRLRVGVYATNVISELFFRQVVGRFVRVIPDLDEQNSYLFIPHDDVLVSYAHMIKEERDHQLEEEIRQTEREIREWQAGEKQLALFKAITASEATPDELIYDQESYSQDELARAKQIKYGAGIGDIVPDAQIAKLLRIAGIATPTGNPEPIGVTPIQEPLYIRKQHVRKTVSRLVGLWCAMSGQEHREANRQLYTMTGKFVKDSELLELEQRIHIVEGWIKGLRDATERATS